MSTRAQAIAARREIVAVRYRAGLSAEQVAAELGVSAQTILNDLKALGIERRPHGPRPGTARRIGTPAQVAARRENVRDLYPAGVPASEIGRRLGVSKATVLEDLRALGITPRPSGRQPESPLPEERSCAREGCPNRFRPRRSQVIRGWGRFCSVPCMASDLVRRAASREWVTARNRARRARLDELKTGSDLLETHEVAELCGVEIATVTYYQRTGMLDAERVTLDGLPFLLFDRSSVDRHIHDWRREGTPQRRLWLEPDFVVAVAEARGLVEREAGVTGLSVEDIRAARLDRVRRRRAKFPAPRGRPKSAGPPPHHHEWLEMYLVKQDELEMSYASDVELGLAEERPPSRMDVALAVAEDDFRFHPERWQDYRASRSDPHSLDPTLVKPASVRIWNGIKPLLNTLKENQ